MCELDMSMWKRLRSARFLPWAAVLPIAVAACSSVDDHVDMAESDITGGVRPGGQALAAVAYLYGGVQTNCTATLIAPKLVLTAKHCAPAVSIYFRLGTPERFEVSVVRRFDAKRDTGGFAELGLDLTVLELQRPVTNIEPMKVLSGALPEIAVGARFGAVGWGGHTNRLVYYDEGSEWVGTLMLQGTRGAPFLQRFGSEQGIYEAALRARLGDRYTPLFPENARRRNEAKKLAAFQLEEGAEALLGTAEGDSAICHGDSGGPLIVRIGDELAVGGVVSGVAYVGSVCGLLGALYTVLGPEAQALLDSAAAAVGPEGAFQRIDFVAPFTGSPAKLPPPDANDPCRGLSPAGRCEAGAALRCLRPDEENFSSTSGTGIRKPVRVDCTLLGSDCGMVETRDPERPSLSMPHATCVSP